LYFSSIARIVYGDERLWRRVRNELADHLLEAIMRHEFNHNQEQWVLHYIQHYERRYDANGKRLPDVLVPVTVREYAEMMRTPQRWGLSDELHIAARRYGMDFVLLNGTSAQLYKHVAPNMLNILSVRL